jgi:hypothetical protein
MVGMPVLPAAGGTVRHSRVRLVHGSSWYHRELTRATANFLAMRAIDVRLDMTALRGAALHPSRETPDGVVYRPSDDERARMTLGSAEVYLPCRL